MTESPALNALAETQKDALIQALLAQLAAARETIAEQAARITALEAQLARPPKTPDNSSKPPSQGQKPTRGQATGERPPRKSRPGVGRTLHPNPDRVVDVTLQHCPKCQAAFPHEQQSPQQVYERIELPPIKPDVTQVRRFGGRCACCGESVMAAAPAGLEPGPTFGRSIAALVVYLHYAHAIGMERLSRLMAEMFALSISEGSISKILQRAREPMLAAAATIQDTVLASPVVCSDETSVRVNGKPWWEWVFIGTRSVLHVIRPSRGKAVVQTLFGTIRPTVWVSDMLGSQRGHAAEWQVCLAHLLRDTVYAIECGDTAFSLPFKWLLLRAIAISRRRPGLKDSTLAQYRADLDRRLTRLMDIEPIGTEGIKFRRRIARIRGYLFVFVTNRAVPPTNNVSERHLRPSVIFRKVTNGFRCEWGAETYAAFRSVVSTAKANGASVLEVLRTVLAADHPELPLTDPG